MVEMKTVPRACGDYLITHGVHNALSSKWGGSLVLWHLETFLPGTGPVINRVGKPPLPCAVSLSLLYYDYGVLFKYTAFIILIL